MPSVHHLLTTASYGGDRVPGSTLREVICSALEERGAEEVRVVTYTCHHFIHPEHGSLLEAWTSLSTRERADIRERYPRLFTAIFLACKAMNAEDGLPSRTDRCGHDE